MGGRQTRTYRDKPIRDFYSAVYAAFDLADPKVESQMREKQTEQRLVKAVKAAGGICPKLVSPGTDGMPDRMVPSTRWPYRLCGGKNAGGQKPRPLQVRRHEQLRMLGFKVYVLDDVNDIPGIIREIEGDDEHDNRAAERGKLRSYSMSGIF